MDDVVVGGNVMLGARHCCGPSTAAIAARRVLTAMKTARISPTSLVR